MTKNKPEKPLEQILEEAGYELEGEGQYYINPACILKKYPIGHETLMVIKPPQTFNARGQYYVKLYRKKVEE